jgi:outer membrane protein OmpA-like peptidoglycan-associated protein
MNTLETYQSDAVERPLIRRRLFWALLVSLLLHVGIVVWFRQTHLPQFNPPVDRLVPRIFNVRDITINEAALEGDDKKEAPKPVESKPAQKPLEVPDEKPLAEVNDATMTPVAPAPADIVKPVASDKPIANPDDVQAIARVQESAQKVMEEDLASLKDSILKDQPSNVPNSLIKLPDSQSDTAHSDRQGMNVASQRLDNLLGHGLHAGDAPVTLPGGALFEFASSDLQNGAIEQLHKLGMLIKKNPNVTFTIEGYTDSFGDLAYNQQLSQERADSVRTWLVQNMDVDPTHIQAVGYGATKFLVMPRPVDMHSQASIDQEKLLEQPNRRVEIRFKFHSAQ